MTQMIAIAILGVICGFILCDLRTKTFGNLHIERSSYGNRIYVSISDNYGAKIRGQYVRLRVIREDVPDEDHEKYILKEKE